MTAPRLNTADPRELAAGLDLLKEGEAPELSILLAAQKARVEGGISAELVEALERIRPEGELQQVMRLTLLCDYYRDNPTRDPWHDTGGVVGYDVLLWTLRHHSPRGAINATRCDADDAYRRAEWLKAEMLYTEAGNASENADFRDEQLDRARDCRRQAYRDGLVHVDPGPATREPRNDWEQSQWHLESVGRFIEDGSVYMAASCASAGLEVIRGTDASGPLASGGRGILAAALIGFGEEARRSPMFVGSRFEEPAKEDMRPLPDFMAGVSLQVAALCGDRELFDRSWAILEKRCRGEWKSRRREILTPAECKEMVDGVL